MQISVLRRNSMPSAFLPRRASLSDVEGAIHTPASLSRWFATEHAPHSLSVKLVTDDCNHNSASAVVLQMERGEFHPRKDYLDLMMQFGACVAARGAGRRGVVVVCNHHVNLRALGVCVGAGYVCMFTICWALLPLAAVINNVFEVRGDIFKVMYGMRRPVPREDSTIGEWRWVLRLAMALAVPVATTMIVIATGQVRGLWCACVIFLCDCAKCILARAVVCWCYSLSTGSAATATPSKSSWPRTSRV